MYISGYPELINTTSSATTGNDKLGKDAFLKLLVTQLQYQDPLAPQDNAEFIAQMSQLSTVESLENISKELTNLYAAEQQFQSINLLGKNLTALDSAGNEILGRVESVKFSAEGPMITINGQEISLSQISGISLADETRTNE